MATQDSDRVQLVSDVATLAECSYEKAASAIRICGGDIPKALQLLVSIKRTASGAPAEVSHAARVPLSKGASKSSISPPFSTTGFSTPPSSTDAAATNYNMLNSR
jgi:hypothetical protein